MIKGSELIGGKIFDSNNHLMDYHVKELVYCLKKLKVLGLIVEKQPKGKGKKVVPYKKIKDIRQQEIVITSHREILSPSQIPEIEVALENPSVMIGFEIYGMKGELVGIVKDTLIEIKTGKIVALLISEGVLTDIINGYGIIFLSEHINFDKKNIILNHVNMNDMIYYQYGGLKKMLGIEQEN
ncbi:PRC-barrel domain-containing protein [Alkaliphilus transvaalensis]|uniref:PRC-barrel domain-containing protein n=1 Tax=Alkaliphilus transvaalensis TaxID=114628 RepID=UPI00047ECFC4|nr:PRC-barrel domain-containing protein [Alkaliphilus transvaalensis]